MKISSKNLIIGLFYLYLIDENVFIYVEDGQIHVICEKKIKAAEAKRLMALGFERENETFVAWV